MAITEGVSPAHILIPLQYKLSQRKTYPISIGLNRGALRVSGSARHKIVDKWYRKGILIASREIRMGPPTTEMLHDKAVGLDLRPLDEVAGILGAAQLEAARSVLRVGPALADGARAMAETLRGGGRLYYVGAGSSGLMAAADAQELGGTFGIPETRVRILMAGGQPTSAAMPGGTEDEAFGLDTGLAELTAQDTLIAVAASGATPYTLEAVRIAKARGARVIAL
ncbi:MAG TPA: hypothetical protein DIU07_04690, partial [Rhodobacteraceae bacterium]|nr:hypothetical protein [Paracoccaceae bacterium]